MLSMSTRRTFLTLSSAAFASALTPIRIVAQALSSRSGPGVFSNAALGAYQQNELTFQRFQSLVGSTFHAFLDNHEVIEVTLLSAVANAPRASTVKPILDGSQARSMPVAALPPTGKCFTLRFSTGSTVVPQGSYVLDSGTTGSFTVLLVSGTAGTSRPTASATFNYR
jgi:hypothetical protein